MKVYLVYFFSDYLNMYDPVHRVEHVVLAELQAIKLVEYENERLKKRKDYDKAQNAYFECHTVEGSL